MKGGILKRLKRNNERGYIKETWKEQWKGVYLRDLKGTMKGGILKRLKRNNERGYRVTWESRKLVETYKSSIWCSCLEKLRKNCVKIIPNIQVFEMFFKKLLKWGDIGKKIIKIF